MNQRSGRIYPSAPLEKNIDLGQRLEKKTILMVLIAISTTF